MLVPWRLHGWWKKQMAFYLSNYPTLRDPVAAFHQGTPFDLSGSGERRVWGGGACLKTNLPESQHAPENSRISLEKFI